MDEPIQQVSPTLDSLLSGILGPTLLEKVKIIIKDDRLPNQPKELYYGNREYKRHLLLSKGDLKHHIQRGYIRNDVRRLLQKRGTQMLFRLREGNGKAVYFVGVEDSGKAEKGLSLEEFRESLLTLIQITETTKININKLVIYRWSNDDDLQHESRYIFIVRMSKVDMDEIII
jgi:hypothetical protein